MDRYQHIVFYSSSSWPTSLQKSSRATFLCHSSDPSPFSWESEPTPSPVAIQLQASLTSLSCSLGIATLLRRALCGCLCGGETEGRCGSFPGWDSLSVTHWVSLLWVCVSSLSLSDVLCLPGVAPRAPC